MNNVFGSASGAHILVHEREKPRHFAAYYIREDGRWHNDAIGYGVTAEEAARLLWHELQRRRRTDELEF